jgi:P-type Ca2+ transporter type 2B
LSFIPYIYRVNLIMDSLASLALATERPTDSLLNQPPHSAEESLISPTLLKHMAGQSAYQLVVMGVLVTQGPALLGTEPGDYTLAFNTFVQMQLFNQLNCRKIHNEPDVLSGVLDSPLFVGILAGEFVMQALIVQYGGPWFHTTPLSPSLWGVSLGFGALGLLVRAALVRVRAPALFADLLAARGRRSLS